MKIVRPFIFLISIYNEMLYHPWSVQYFWIWEQLDVYLTLTANFPFIKNEFIIHNEYELYCGVGSLIMLLIQINVMNLCRFTILFDKLMYLCNAYICWSHILTPSSALHHSVLRVCDSWFPIWCYLFLPSECSPRGQELVQVKWPQRLLWLVNVVQCCRQVIAYHCHSHY